MRTAIFVVAALLAASCGGGSETTAASSGQPGSEQSDDAFVYSPVAGIADHDLEGLLPGLTDLPAGWVRIVDDGSGVSGELCDRLASRTDTADLGLPYAVVDYSSADGGQGNEASVVVFATAADAQHRLDESFDVFFDPECADGSLESEGIKFDITIRETNTGVDEMRGVIMKMSLAEDADGLAAGTIVGYFLSGAGLIGRCQISMRLAATGFLPAVPSQSVIDEWTRPVVDNVAGYTPCVDS